MSLAVAPAVYGLITVSALLAAESSSTETYGETVLAVALALLLYWLAESYAQLVSWRARGPAAHAGGTRPHDAARVADADRRGPAADHGPDSVGRGASLSTAIVAALWTAAGAIVLIEAATGARAHPSGRELVLQTLVGATLGVLVLALRLALHQVAGSRRSAISRGRGQYSRGMTPAELVHTGRTPDAIALFALERSDEDGLASALAAAVSH